LLHIERKNRLAVITLDRPERRNALDRATLGELQNAFAEVSDARVVILTGAGGHFCAGADLSGVEDPSFASAVRGVLDAMRAMPQPVIAAIEGFALGAGTQLAIAADLRVATDEAVFGIPAAKLGLLVDHWTVRRLVEVFGHSMARSMLMTADQVSGADARAVGAIRRTGGLDVALEWAEEIVRLAPLTQQGAKVGLNALDPDVDTADYEDYFARAWASDDLAEGLTAFGERRPPEFEGR